MSEETKRRIIEAGAKLIHQRGYNNTGLKDILKAANVPKGSFYFYFENKEAFGIEIVNFYREQFRGMVKGVLKDKNLSPIERLQSILNTFHAYFKAQGYTQGCPIGNLAQEMGDLSNPFRSKLKEAMDGMASAFASILLDAQRMGEVPGDLNTRDASIFIVEAWHGAIIRMKVTKDDEALNLFNQFIFDKLLK